MHNACLFGKLLLIIMASGDRSSFQNKLKSLEKQRRDGSAQKQDKKQKGFYPHNRRKLLMQTVNMLYKSMYLHTVLM